jgi:hypothetical protein
MNIRGDPRVFKRWVKAQHYADPEYIKTANFILALLEFGRDNDCLDEIVEYLDEGIEKQ